MAAKKANRTSIMPTVGDGSALARVLDAQVVTRVSMDAAGDALVDAMLADKAQLVEQHLAERRRYLAGTQALTEKVQEVQA